MQTLSSMNWIPVAEFIPKTITDTPQAPPYHFVLESLALRYPVQEFTKFNHILLLKVQFVWNVLLFIIS